MVADVNPKQIWIFNFALFYRVKYGLLNTTLVSTSNVSMDFAFQQSINYLLRKLVNDNIIRGLNGNGKNIF